MWNPISHDRSFFAIARRSRSDPETKYHRKDAKVAKTPFFAPFVVKNFFADWIVRSRSLSSGRPSAGPEDGF